MKTFFRGACHQSRPLAVMWPPLPLNVPASPDSPMTSMRSSPFVMRFFTTTSGKPKFLGTTMVNSGSLAHRREVSTPPRSRFFFEPGEFGGEFGGDRWGRSGGGVRGRSPNSGSSGTEPKLGARSAGEIGDSSRTRPNRLDTTAILSTASPSQSPPATAQGGQKSPRSGPKNRCQTKPISRIQDRPHVLLVQ